MSASRVRLLETLEGQPEPTTLASLVAATGLHANTVREHLDGLVRRGLVTRHRAAAVGRGRPAWLYEATSRAQQDRASEYRASEYRASEYRASEYAGLAAALAGAIHRTSDRPSEDAALAGEEWGRELARDHGRPRDTGPDAVRGEVVSLLDAIGFAPQPADEGTCVRLTRCPLLEAAHRYPDVVCAVHLGLVRGALAEYAEPDGADAGDQSATDDVRLLPFAEPGACLLHLTDAGSPR